MIIDKMHNPEDRVVLQSGRTDLKPGEVFEVLGKEYRAITYPHGATLSTPFPGISIDMSPPFDPDIYTPAVGEVTAIETSKEF